MLTSIQCSECDASRCSQYVPLILQNPLRLIEYGRCSHEGTKPATPALSGCNNIFLVQVEQQVDKRLKKSFKEQIDILKKEASDAKRTMFIPKPDGTVYEVVCVHVTEDGQWRNMRKLGSWLAHGACHFW